MLSFLHVDIAWYQVKRGFKKKSEDKKSYKKNNNKKQLGNVHSFWGQIFAWQQQFELLT